MAKNKPGAKAPSKAVPVDPSVAVAALPINYKVRVFVRVCKEIHTNHYTTPILCWQHPRNRLSPSMLPSSPSWG